jgi:hypothetical protein
MQLTAAVAPATPARCSPSLPGGAWTPSRRAPYQREPYITRGRRRPRRRRRRWNTRGIQRFGGALNLNVHFHTVIPDGVFVAAGDGPARYFPIAQPRDEDVAAILAVDVARGATGR